jgi:hypothetical protein
MTAVVFEFPPSSNEELALRHARIGIYIRAALNRN